MRGHHGLALKQLDRQRLLHDYGVVQVAHQLLRPLLEGMALFQEFDARPGASDVFSTPGYWAALLFQPLDQDLPQIQDPKEISRWLTHEIIETLDWYRASNHARQRKVGVLMRSLSNDPHSYLNGYLETHVRQHALPFAEEFGKRALKHAQVLADSRGFVPGMGANSWREIESRLQPSTFRATRKRIGAILGGIADFFRPRETK